MSSRRRILPSAGWIANAPYSAPLPSAWQRWLRSHQRWGRTASTVCPPSLRCLRLPIPTVRLPALILLHMLTSKNWHRLTIRRCGGV